MKGTSRSLGQALVELALGLPLVLLLIFGVLELGRAFFTKIALTNAAREGANYLVYHRDDVSTNFVYTKIHVQKEIANAAGLNIATDEITVQCLDVTIDAFTGEITSEVVDNTCPGRSTVEVTITNQHPVTIFYYFIGEYTLQANARMVVP
jgi:Flp pilus assembly protein TadG